MKQILSLMLLACLAFGASAQIVDAELATKPADETVFYQTPTIEKKNTFIVISKAELRLYVYGKVGGDTVLMAKFPACLSKNKGQKQRRGDMKTPECTQAKPFHIDAIKDASAWYHDFKDGRALASMAAPTTRNRFPAVPARAAYACATRILFSLRRSMPISTCR